eukprot:snap_masked-scaffold199_size265817-processed-gene-1.32 protein:Tk08951 transcript:snap_masked-scaffold199_size265817-processed-gene-1.32-mRNA-1 annotation:"conserved hypothetical protein"
MDVVPILFLALCSQIQGKAIHVGYGYPAAIQPQTGYGSPAALPFGSSYGSPAALDTGYGSPAALDTGYGSPAAVALDTGYGSPAALPLDTGYGSPAALPLDTGYGAPQAPPLSVVPLPTPQPIVPVNPVPEFFLPPARPLPPTPIEDLNLAHPAPPLLAPDFRVLRTNAMNPYFSTPYAPIQSQYHAQDEFGGFSFGYESQDSAKSERRRADGVTRGQYSYVDANGQLQSVEYVSDAFNGFQVSGTNIPVTQPYVVQDTPEVVAARAAFQKAFDDALARTL